MNADLHMAEDLKNTGKGNLFVIFGEPDIDILDAPDEQLQVKVNGVDVFDPSTGEVRSDSASGIACWFIDTDYNEESFLSATPTSSAPTIPARRSRPRSRPRSTRTPGRRSTAIPHGRSTSRSLGASP
jgi:hypothetical protein